MKLLFAIKSLNNAHGGAEKVLADVTAGLSARGHDVSVVTFDEKGGQSFYPLSGGVRRIDLGIGDTARHSTFPQSFPRMKALRQVVRQERPDLVIPFMHSMFIPMAFSLVGTGVPVLASEHIVPDHYKSRRGEFILFLLSSIFMKTVTVLSEKVRQSYPKFLRRKMVVVPNPISVPPANKTVGKTGRVILNVGRLDDQKDQQCLIAAFARLAPEYPEWVLRIIGEGELRSALERQVMECGLAGRVFLPGLTQAIGGEYAQADIFAMSSRYESFGLATVEAMSFAVPAVGFADCPGTNEVIEDGKNGILVEGTDRVSAFADGLKRLMDSETLRSDLGAWAKESVSRYSTENVLDTWEALCRSVSGYRKVASGGREVSGS